MHQQWDLRFTTIEYLPKGSETEPQRFRYTTRIGLGIQVSGEGESIATRQSADGQWTSALKFWSDQPISLIEWGSGYWKYIPEGASVRFLTWYDYQVRFGAPGKFFDWLLFRPLIGWATAWSFDALRLWLEQGIPPAQSIRRTYIQLTAQLALAGTWVYQGLVPKLLFPDTGELAILRATGLFDGLEPLVLTIVGGGQIIFGTIFLAFGFRAWLHYLNICVLIALGWGALLGDKALLIAPFNPVSLTLAMVALSVISIVNAKDLPAAGNCLRKPHKP
ncbi:MAG: DoxX-like family protein [Litorilinea sp.]